MPGLTISAVKGCFPIHFRKLVSKMLSGKSARIDRNQVVHENEFRRTGAPTAAPEQQGKQAVNFRSMSDLLLTVRRQRHKFPRDIDLVVGVPRSGLLAAAAVSLQLHRPLTDLNSFLEGRLYGGFSRRIGAQATGHSSDIRSVLVVDDSITTGYAMQEVKYSLQGLSKKYELIFAAIYGLYERHSEVDVVLEKCALPRVFEWNVLNHPHLNRLCVDLDGVLCRDPEKDEDDDGVRYIQFLKSVAALNVPRYKINSIVTARLEKYRPQTEDWLQDNGIQYENLFMLDLPSAKERRGLSHAEFKSEIYRSKKDCWLFIESSTAQAREIREQSGKGVLAYQDMIFFPEGQAARIQRIATRSGFRRVVGQILPRQFKPIIKSVLGM